jgi:hypothetical protein
MIRQLPDATELTGVSPVQLVDALVCVPKGRPLFAPLMGERVLYDRRLHQMTLVFDTKTNSVFLHDPNGRSLFNDDNTHILLGKYIELVNGVLVEYGLKRYEYVTYHLPNINMPLNRLWITVLVGNCVVASIVFMIMYNDLQDMSYITRVFEMSKRKEHDKLYTAFYNKIEQLLGLIL